jgi:hypothetical protein
MQNRPSREFGTAFLRTLLTIKKKKKETINNNAQLFIVGKNRQRHLRPSVIDN